MAPEPKPIQQPYGETVTDYTELLARLDSNVKAGWSPKDMGDAAAAIRDLTAQLEAERKAREKAEQPEMRHMVTRFLKWPLPPSVCVDLCATDYGKEGRVGTNLLTAEEAENMLRYVLRGRAFAYGMLKMEAEGLRKRADAAEAKVKAMAQRFQEQGDECLRRTEEAEAKLAAVEAEKQRLAEGLNIALNIASCAHRGELEWNQLESLRALRTAAAQDTKPQVEQCKASVPPASAAVPDLVPGLELAAEICDEMLREVAGGEMVSRTIRAEIEKRK